MAAIYAMAGDPRAKIIPTLDLRPSSSQPSKGMEFSWEGEFALWYSRSNKAIFVVERLFVLEAQSPLNICMAAGHESGHRLYHTNSASFGKVCRNEVEAYSAEVGDTELVRNHVRSIHGTPPLLSAVWEADLKRIDAAATRDARLYSLRQELDAAAQSIEASLTQSPQTLGVPPGANIPNLPSPQPPRSPTGWPGVPGFHDSGQADLSALRASAYSLARNPDLGDSATLIELGDLHLRLTLSSPSLRTREPLDTTNISSDISSAVALAVRLQKDQLALKKTTEDYAEALNTFQDWDRTAH